MNDKNNRIIRGILLLTAVSFVCAGIARGEISTVLAKAVNLCLECIGIG